MGHAFLPELGAGCWAVFVFGLRALTQHTAESRRAGSGSAAVRQCDSAAVLSAAAAGVGVGVGVGTE
jgi:hypothetical protein